MKPATTVAKHTIPESLEYARYFYGYFAFNFR